jgi:hypothetical protein
MAIVKAVQKPCWIAQGLPEGDEEHYATRAEAIRAALAYDGGARMFRCPVLCYSAFCDGCGYGEGEGESVAYHLPALEPYHVLMDLSELQRQERGGLLCGDCAVAADSDALPLVFRATHAERLALGHRSVLEASAGLLDVADQLEVPAELRPWPVLEAAR